VKHAQRSEVLVSFHSQILQRTTQQIPSIQQQPQPVRNGQAATRTNVRLTFSLRPQLMSACTPSNNVNWSLNCAQGSLHRAETSRNCAQASQNKTAIRFTDRGMDAIRLMGYLQSSQQTSNYTARLSDVETTKPIHFALSLVISVALIALRRRGFLTS
jgi:hypothetical protein